MIMVIHTLKEPCDPDIAHMKLNLVYFMYHGMDYLDIGQMNILMLLNTGIMHVMEEDSFKKWAIQSASSREAF